MDEMQAVILAGGFATRMRPRTMTVPKFLLPVGGRPFGAWLLECLAGSGYSRVLICIAHLGDQIRTAIGDGRAFGLEVAYSDEGDQLLGTAGAIRRASAELAPQFLVTYGDSYLPFDYGAPLRMLEERADADGVMAVFKNEGRWDRSNTSVRVDERGELWVDRYEKGTHDPKLDHIDYGATALRRDVILGIPEATPWGLDQVQAELAARGRLRAYLAHARFFEIGSEAGLLELDRELSARPPNAPTITGGPKAAPSNTTKAKT
jgi:N-acetyl-alpha-D-muramate 1-phosphate uridylyltransferase